MAIRENATVNVIDGLYKGRTGKVVKIHDYAEIAVVSFDDNGDLGKVSLSALVEVQSQTDRIVDVKIEIPEGAKKISQAEFMEAIGQVTKPDKIIEKVGAEMGFLIGMTVMIGALKLAKRLFEESEIIVITKDQLLRAIAESAADEDPKFMVVGLTNAFILRGIVDILFGGENG